MNANKPLGIRVNKDFLKKVEELGKQEHLDRSTTMRVLLEEGYTMHIKKKAAEEYVAGKITISKAAEKANITVWEMEQFLVSQGFKSQYSLDDLEEEMKLLRK